MIAVQVAGSLLSLFGLSAIFLTWKRRGEREGLWRYSLPAGWTLVALGLVLWAISSNIDHGIALGVTAVIVIACTMVAVQGLKLITAPVKTQKDRETTSDTLALGPGYWGRVFIRLTGCLVIAPVFGAVLGILWQAFVPGDPADRLVGLGFVATFGVTAGLVIQLASRRPWRACAGLTVVSAVAAAIVFVPRLF